MINVGSRAFASSVAARYAAEPRRRLRVGRVLLQLGVRGRATARRQRAQAGFTLRLTHRLLLEDRTLVRLTRAQTLVQRIERHLTATRHMVERTQRVEQVALRGTTLPHLLPGTHSQAASRAPTPILVPPLPRVLRRPASPAPATDPPRTFDASSARRQQGSAHPAIDVARLTDEVMRGIDKRLAAWRERRGRV